MKKFEQTIPKSQMAIVKDALTCYQQTLIVANKSRGESGEAALEHPIFDIHSLIGLLDREVTVVLTQDEVDSFGNYGVDFPEFVPENKYGLKEITPPTHDFDWYSRNAIFNQVLDVLRDYSKGGSHPSEMLDEYCKAYGEHTDAVLGNKFTDEIIEMNRFSDGDITQDKLGIEEYVTNRLNP